MREHAYLPEPTWARTLSTRSALLTRFHETKRCDLAAQVSARTICMQFEGHSTTVSDIVVDAVGKYAYAIGSPHTLELPVIMDVALEERTKVLQNRKQEKRKTQLLAPMTEPDHRWSCLSSWTSRQGASEIAQSPLCLRGSCE